MSCVVKGFMCVKKGDPYNIITSESLEVILEDWERMPARHVKFESIYHGQYIAEAIKNYFEFSDDKCQEKCWE